MVSSWIHIILIWWVVDQQFFITTHQKVVFGKLIVIVALFNSLTIILILWSQKKKWKLSPTWMDFWPPKNTLNELRFLVSCLSLISCLAAGWDYQGQQIRPGHSRGCCSSEVSMLLILRSINLPQTVDWIKQGSHLLVIGNIWSLWSEHNGRWGVGACNFWLED